MPASRRKRYNLVGTTLSTSLGNNPITDTTIAFNAALKEGGSFGTNIPTLGTYDYIVLRVDNEIMYLTAYVSGTLSGTVLRAQEGSVIATHDAGATVKQIASKLDFSPAIPLKDNLWNPMNAGHALDDEFDDDIIDLAWNRVDRSDNIAPLVYTEGAGVMSLKHEGLDNSQEWHGFMKSIGGATPPLTIETCLRIASPYAVNYCMSGIGFSDGLTYGADKQLFVHGYVNSSNGSGLYLTQYTNTNWNTSTTFGTAYAQSSSAGGRYYFRLQWSAANLFSAWWSGDGVSWIQTISNGAYTFTPTHAGLIHSHYGGNLKTITTWEYFRAF